MSILTDTSSEQIHSTNHLVRGVSYAAAGPLCAAVDLLVVIISAVTAAFGYHLIILKTTGDIDSSAGIGLVVGLAYVICAHQMRLYRIHELVRDGGGYRRIIASWAIANITLVVVLFVLKAGSSVSRGAIISFAAFGLMLLLTSREIAKRLLRGALEAGALCGRRAILLGDTSELSRYARPDLLSRFGIHEVKRIALPSFKSSRTVAALAAVDSAMRWAREAAAEEIVLALPWSDTAQFQLVRSHLQLTPLPVRLLPDRSVSAVLAQDVVSRPSGFLVEVQRGPLSSPERFLKRLLDIAIAAVTLVLLSPLMGVTAAAIALGSRGPIIFRQRRKGFNGREFTILKFRTMRVMEDGPVIAQATRRDKRVTMIGRFLRKTSIDELPQLINVLQGDMAIVGPRPHAIAHDDEYGKIIANYAFRHHVKPGMTGWAQVQGYRGATPRVEIMAKRVELDLWYINNWSFRLDINIILRTCFALMANRNAY